MKKLLFLTATFLMAISSFAQGFGEDEGFGGFSVDTRKNVVSLGVKGGVNLSTMTKYKETDLGLKAGVGFEVGAVISARFGKRTQGSDAGTGMFAIQLEPGFAQHTIGTKSESIKLSCFEMPVLLKIFVTPNVNIEVGPSICGVLSASPDVLYADVTGIAIGDIKGFDLKACLGVSYETKNGLYASLRYNLGTSKLAKNFPCKVSAANLTVGYKFNIFKF